VIRLIRRRPWFLALVTVEIAAGAVVWIAVFA
jgi:hypothetical protein